MVIPRLLPNWLAIFAVLVLVSDSFAQRPVQIPKDQISSAGTIKAVQNGVFHVVNVGGDQWLLAVEKDADEVVLRGNATPQWLRPGMPVRFQGNFAKNKSGEPQGEAKDRITELKEFTTREDSKLGVKEEAKRGSFLSGGPKSDSPLETAPFTIVGVLAKYKGGRMTVAVGSNQVQAQLAEGAKIEVDVADLRFAGVGDEIEFEGWSYVSQKEQVHATKVWITIARSLGEENAKQVSKKDATAADDNASEEQKAVAKKIQTAIARAKKEYDAGAFADASGTVASIIEQWAGFIKSDEAIAARLLHPQHKQLKLVHAFLEMEGCMLPMLPELPEIDEVAAR